MKITVIPYDPRWPELFKAEQKLIEGALGQLARSIDHIGSTSVPGLAAKPIIDILIGVKEEKDLNMTIEPMKKSGYTYFRIYEPAMPYRRLFVRLKQLNSRQVPQLIDVGEEYIAGKDFISRVNIHTMVKGTPEWMRHMAFRDYLRTHPQTRNEYGELKMELSKKEFDHQHGYNEAKNDFVKRTEKLAVEWYKKTTGHEQNH